MTTPDLDITVAQTPAASPEGEVAEEQGNWLRGAVTRCLADFLRARQAEAAHTDDDFTRSVVDRLAAFVLDGGKRLRPTFAWWGWRAAGGVDDRDPKYPALRAVSALELIQACALIQDDVMDGSALRRGGPSVHMRFAMDHHEGGWSGDPRRYGHSAAVLAGDLALVWSDDMLSDALATQKDAGTRVRGPWRAMRTEMIAGQFLDVRAQARTDETESTALRVNRLKTAAYSVERPLHFGVALAGGSQALADALRGYGTAIGCAFQLRDDLLDLYGDPARTGKPIGGDLREGKRTLLLATGLRLLREHGAVGETESLTKAVGNPELSDAEVRNVAELLDRAGARAAVEARVREYLLRGLRSLDSAPISEPVRDGLFTLAHQAATRKY